MDENKNNKKKNMNFANFFLAYLDILGIKSKVKKKGQSNSDEIMHIITSLNINRYFPQYGQKSTSDHGNIVFYNWYFSDTFVFMTETANINSLSHLFLIVRYIHDKFLKKNLLVRGAIVKGNMYKDVDPCKNRILLGPAIIKAYEIESEIAIYPRIVISDELYTFIEENKDKIEAKGIIIKEGNLLDIIKQDFDGVYFFDVLNKNILRGKKEKINTRNSIFYISSKISDENNYQSIYNKVETIIQKHSKEFKVKQKIGWLKSYLKLCQN